MLKPREALADPIDIEALLAEIWPHAFRIAFSMLRARAAAEDAAQEACAAVMRSIGDLRSPEAFGVWFYRIVVREALRVERRARSCDALDEATPAAPGAMSDALVRIDVLRALGKLSSTQRAVVTLRYYADLNSSEIADVLGMPAPTVRFHLAAARRSLERLLDGHGSKSAGIERAYAR